MIHGSPGSSRWAGFFCLWLIMWSNPNRKISKERKGAENKKESAVFSRKQRILWSCCPDLNWRPHPYQLIANPQSTAFRRFGGIFVPGNRRQWCFPLHCLRPLVSYCGSTCGSGANWFLVCWHIPRCLHVCLWLAVRSKPQATVFGERKSTQTCGDGLHQCLQRENLKVML